MSDRRSSSVAEETHVAPPESAAGTGRSRFVGFLRRRWFLLGLLVAIPAGLALGRGGSTDPHTFARLAKPVIFVVLFLMAFTLDSRALLASLTRPKAVLWALAVNLLALPLLAAVAFRVQLLADYAVGLAIMGAVPCTMAAASVWTRRAGGNDAVSLLVTLLTNGLCFTFTPFWVGVLVGASVEFDRTAMLLQLLWTALLPSALGQIARLLLQGRLPIDSARGPLGTIAMGGVLVIVFGASMKAGPQIASIAGATGAAATLVMIVSALVLHLAAAAIAYYGGLHLLRLPRADAVAALFAGSQKTLPIAILIATDPRMLGDAGVPFAILPLLVFHALQLVADTVLADRLRRAGEPPATENDAATE